MTVLSVYRKVSTQHTVFVVVSHIQRIGCQPEKLLYIHGDQSRSWSAEQRKEKKRKSLAAYTYTHPPTPHAAHSEKK